MPNPQHQLLSTTDSGKLTWNRLPSTGVNHYRHHINDSSMTLTLQTNRTERPNFTNGSRLTNHDRPTPLGSYSQQHHGKTDQSVYTNRTKNIRLTTTIHLTLKMTSAQVVETSVITTDHSPSQDYTIKPHYYEKFSLGHSRKLEG